MMFSEKQWRDVTEVCAITREQPSEAQMMQTLTKLHKNLGHPPNADMVRLLKHGQASDHALNLARKFTCPFCQSREKPKTPLPANTDRVCEFNKQLEWMSSICKVGRQIKRLRL